MCDGDDGYDVDQGDIVTMVLIYIDDFDDDYMTVTIVTLLMTRSGCL